MLLYGSPFPLVFSFVARSCPIVCSGTCFHLRHPVPLCFSRYLLRSHRVCPSHGMCVPSDTYPAETLCPVSMLLTTLPPLGLADFRRSPAGFLTLYPFRLADLYATTPFVFYPVYVRCGLGVVCVTSKGAARALCASYLFRRLSLPSTHDAGWLLLPPASLAPVVFRSRLSYPSPVFTLSW